MAEYTHYRKLFNPDYIGAWAFEPKEGKTVTIDYVKVEAVVGVDGKREECTVVHFVEDVKPLILNATNGKMITKVLGTPYIEEWRGERIKLHVQKVRAFGDVVDAVRVMSTRPPKAAPTEPPLLCADCAKPLTQFKNMTPRQLADYTKCKYGRVLCPDCASSAKNGDSNEEDEE